MTRPRRARLRSTILALAGAMVAAGAARGERVIPPDETPDELAGIGIDQKLDAQVPLDLVFTDEHGREITLAEYFEPGRPVILTMNFYRCQMLCSLTLNGVLDAIRGIDWTAGEEFEIVTVSFAPEETHDLAALKRKSYVESYGRDTDGWHFLTGSEESIAALADAIGFRFRKVAGQDGDDHNYDYAHTSSIQFLTPEGHISLYMNDVQFDPDDVRLALVEASQGEIGSPIEKFLLFTCFRYDPEANSYAMSAMKLMRFAGGMTVIVIGLGLATLFVVKNRSHGGATSRPALSGVES